MPPPVVEIVAQPKGRSLVGAWDCNDPNFPKDHDAFYFDSDGTWTYSGADTSSGAICDQFAVGTFRNDVLMDSPSEDLAIRRVKWLSADRIEIPDDRGPEQYRRRKASSAP